MSNREGDFMDSTIFKATIYPIPSEIFTKLEKNFKKKNFYSTKITLPKDGYSNPEYCRKINNLQTKLWEDVLVQLNHLFEVNSIYQIEDTYKEYVEQFITIYYEPSEDLKKEIELEAPTVLMAHLTAQKNTLPKRKEQLSNFTAGVKTRIRTSLEREAIKKMQNIKIPNKDNRLEIKFTVAFLKN